MFFEIMGVTGIDWQGQSYGACSERFPITLIYGGKNQTAKLSQLSKLWVLSKLRKLLQPKAQVTMGPWTYNLETEVRYVVEKQLNPKSSCMSIGDGGYKNSITYFGMLRTNIDLSMQSFMGKLSKTRVRFPPPPPK